MARRRLLKSDFYLSVNGQSATTADLEFDFAGGTKAVTLIASVPVDFANAEIEEWVSFTWSEVTRNTYSLAVTAQANQGTTQLTGDITIKSLDGRYTVIIQCLEHGNEAYVRINGQTSITSSITCDTSALTFTATTRGGWTFASTGTYPCTSNVTGVTTEGSDTRPITITVGTNTSSSATKEYSFRLTSNKDANIWSEVTITQQVMPNFEITYNGTLLPYTGGTRDFSFVANGNVDILVPQSIASRTSFSENPPYTKPATATTYSKNITLTMAGLDNTFTASTNYDYPFTGTCENTPLEKYFTVSYEPYPYINGTTAQTIDSATSMAQFSVASNYPLEITSRTAGCYAAYNSGWLTVMINESVTYDDKDYEIMLAVEDSSILGPVISQKFVVTREGHGQNDTIEIVPSSMTLTAGDNGHFDLVIHYGGGGVETAVTNMEWWSDDASIATFEYPSQGDVTAGNVSAATSVTIYCRCNKSTLHPTPQTASTILTVEPAIVDEYRNLRFDKNDAKITSWDLSQALFGAYLKKDLYRGETKISTIDETFGMTYEFYEGANLLSSCTIDQQHTYDKYIGCVEFEFDIDTGMTFTKSGLVPISKTYDVKVYDNTVSDNSSPAVLTLTVPADSYTYGNLKFIEGEDIDDPALTQPINLGAEVESEFTYNVVRNIYRNNEFIDNENFTRDAQYTIYSGATTAGTGTGLTIPSQATTYLMFNDNDEFRLYFSNGEENWGYGLEFLTNNGVYPKTYTLVARDNASTVNPTSASVLINVAAREYIDSDLHFYNSAGTVINSFTVPSSTTQTGVTTRYTHLTAEGSSLIDTTPQANFKVYSGETISPSYYITSAATNVISRGIYADNGFFIGFDETTTPPSLRLVADTGLTEQKVFTLVVEKNGLSGRCTFTFEPAPAPAPTNLRFFSGSTVITTVGLASAGTKVNVNTVESVGGTDTTVTSEERMKYALYYTGGTPIANFDCMTAGSKYTGNGLSINYSTTNGLTFTANNDVDYSRTFRLEATDTANTLTTSITITMSAASASYSLFFARTASSGTPISTVSLSANQTVDVYLVVRKTVGSRHEDTIVTAGGEDSDFYSLTAPVDSGFNNWEWYDDLYYPDGHEYVETPENGGLLLYGTDEDLVEPIIRICYNQQGRGGQYTLTGGYGNLTTSITINLQEYGVVTNLYAKILNSIESQPEPMKFRVGVMVNNVFSAISDYVTVSATSSYYGQSGWMNSGITTVPVSAWIEELSSVTFEIYTHATILDDAIAPDYGWFFWNNTEALYRREITTNDRQQAGGFYLYYKTLDLREYDPSELGIMGIQIMRRTS